MKVTLERVIYSRADPYLTVPLCHMSQTLDKCPFVETVQGIMPHKKEKRYFHRDRQEGGGGGGAHDSEDRRKGKRREMGRECEREEVGRGRGGGGERRRRDRGERKRKKEAECKIGKMEGGRRGKRNKRERQRGRKNKGNRGQEREGDWNDSCLSTRNLTLGQKYRNLKARIGRGGQTIRQRQQIDRKAMNEAVRTVQTSATVLHTLSVPINIPHSSQSLKWILHSDYQPYFSFSVFISRVPSQNGKSQAWNIVIRDTPFSSETLDSVCLILITLCRTKKYLLHTTTWTSTRMSINVYMSCYTAQSQAQFVNRTSLLTLSSRQGFCCCNCCCSCCCSVVLGLLALCE